MDYRAHDVYGDGVVFVVGDDDVGVGFRGFDKLLVHGLERLLVALQHFVHVAAAFGYVALESSDEALVRIGVHVNLNVEKVAQFGIGQDQDTFDDHHFARMGQDRIVGAVVRYERIDGLLDVPARLEFF